MIAIVYKEDSLGDFDQKQFFGEFTIEQVEALRMGVYWSGLRSEVFVRATVVYIGICSLYSTVGKFEEWCERNTINITSAMLQNPRGE